MALLICNNLALGYEGKIISENINFSVNEGDYLFILGENGSGKSTLLKTLLGLNTSYKGEIFYSDAFKKNKIGYLPQQTDIQKDFPASVYEIIISGCQANAGFKPFYSKADKQKAVFNAERMNVSNLLKRCYRELSGGQQQRVLLSRALCAAESVLFLDEPVAGLDAAVTEEMYRIIADLNHNNGMTVIMVSHDIAAAKKYATKILFVGEKVLFDNAENFFENEIGHTFLKEGVDL